MSNEISVTPKELATLAGTDAKRMRAFMRSQGFFVGQGNRHAISVEDARAIIEAFNAKGNRSTHAAQRSAEDVHALIFGETDETDALDADEDADEDES